MDLRYKTTINCVHNDWVNIKNKCRRTVNKEYTDNVPGEKFKKNLMISEHSPIRLLEVDWTWRDLEYWASQELARHKFEKFITTQRTDRTGVDRSNLSQAAPVKFDGFANAQNLIDSSRKRLCFQATEEARTAFEELKIQLNPIEPETAFVMVPNCIYRCGCPEFNKCGFFKKFMEKHPDINITNIEERYKAYNDDFYSEHKK